MRFFAIPLLIAAIALPTVAKAEMSAAQKAEVEALVKEYILKNGDVLIQSVNNYQTKQQEEANKQSEGKAKELVAKLKTDKDVASAGNPEGDVLVVEFFDYNCGYCKKAYEEIASLLKDDKNVRIVLYDMPILGPDSLEVSKWALASKKQGKYFEYHKELMTFQGAKDTATLKKLAEKAGLDADKLEKDKTDPAIEEEIKTHLKTAQELGIQGTPGFLINEKIFRGYIPYDAMQAAIKEARGGEAKKQ